jgi:DNA-binding transcriptional LysR family regulator
MDAVNHLGSAALAHAAVELGVQKFVYASTGLVYKDGIGRPSAEHDPTGPAPQYLEAGRGYLVRARSILRSIEEADREVAAHVTGEPRGHLRLALPGSFGRIWLAPLIAEFLAAHPRITIEAEFSNRFVDLIDDGFDLAVRLGELTDSRLVARKICARRRLLCAAPSYLETAGVPRHPDDLARHACLIFSGLKNSDRWEMLDATGTRTRVAVSGPFISDDAEVLIEAAKAGLGIFLATDWLVGRALQAKQLVPLLTAWKLIDEGAIYIVTPSGAGSATKTRAFSDWLVARFSSPPWLAEEFATLLQRALRVSFGRYAHSMTRTAARRAIAADRHPGYRVPRTISPCGD